MANAAKIWHRDFVLVFLANFFTMCSFYFLLAAVPRYITGPLGAGAEMVGLLGTIASLPCLLFRPVAGFLADRLGRRAVYVPAMFVFTAAAFGYVLATSISSLVVIRLVYAIPFALATTTAMTIAGDMVPADRRGEAIGYYALGQILAMGVGPSVATVVLGEGEFSRVFVVGGIVSLGALACSLLLRYRPVQGTDRRFSVQKMYEARVVPVAITTTLITLGYTTLTNFVLLYGIERGISNFGAFFSIYSLGIMLMRFAGGRLMDRKGPKSAIPIGMLTLAVGYVMLARAAGTWSYFAAAFAIGLGWGLAVPSLQAMSLAMVEPESRGAASATYLSGFDLGVGGGAYIMARVATAVGGYSNMYLVSAALTLVSMVLLLGWVLPRYRPTPDHDAEHSALPHIVVR